MANVQLQASGDERDAYASIAPESEDDTLDLTVLCKFDEDTPIRKVVRGLTKIILRMEKGPVTGPEPS